MARQFWVRREDSVRGPFSFQQLEQFAEQGRLSSKDEISDDGQRWLPAHKVSRLNLERKAAPSSPKGKSAKQPRMPDAQQVQAIAAALDKKLKQEEADRVKYEVMLPDKEVVPYKSAAKLRKDLLAGKITRFNKGRAICPPPTVEKIDPGGALSEQAKQQKLADEMRKWTKKTSWRPLGRGLAQEDDEIAVLYRPHWVTAKQWAKRFSEVGFWVVFVPCAMYAVYLVLFNANPGAAGSGRAVSRVLEDP